MNIIKKYFHLCDDLFTEFMKDATHFRVQLVYMSYIFNLIVLYAVIFKGLDWKALTVSFATQTVIYGFYFVSKHNQAQMENQKTPTYEEPSVNRDPEE